MDSPQPAEDTASFRNTVNSPVNEVEVIEQSPEVRTNNSDQGKNVRPGNPKKKNKDPPRKSEMVLRARNPKKKDTDRPSTTKTVPTKYPKKKDTNPPKTSEMVLESIKSLKLRKGASVQAISKHIEGNYDVNMKALLPRINKFLKNSVEKGLLEQVTGAGAIGRFKIRKTENAQKNNKNRKPTIATKKNDKALGKKGRK